MQALVLAKKILKGIWQCSQSIGISFLPDQNAWK